MAAEESESMFTVRDVQKSNDVGSFGRKGADFTSVASSSADSTGRVVVVLGVQKDAFTWISSQLSRSFKSQGCFEIRVIPVLFNLGMGSTSLSESCRHCFITCLSFFLRS